MIGEVSSRRSLNNLSKKKCRKEKGESEKLTTINPRAKLAEGVIVLFKARPPPGTEEDRKTAKKTGGKAKKKKNQYRLQGKKEGQKTPHLLLTR